jgi:hypothetical protein
MRKQELVYLHGLLLEIRTYYQGEAGESVETPGYDAMDVSPAAIHQSKQDHEEAVLTLLTELTKAFGERRQVRAD